MKKTIPIALLTFSLMFGTAMASDKKLKGEWEIGPFIGMGFLDDYGIAQPDDVNFLLGARLGWFLTEEFSLEGSYQAILSETSGGGWMPINSIRFNALWTFLPGKEWRPFLTVGAGAERTGDGIESWDAAPNFGAGLRWLAFDRSGFRFDFRYVPVAVEKTGIVDDWQHNVEANVGWYWLFGKKAEKVAAAPVAAQPVEGDADGDGVKDTADKCPGTPAGATVDASGCPMDSDEDGVLDGLDKCPKTPKGTKIDTMGCPIEGKARGALKGVTFKTNSAELTEGSKTVLDEVVSLLKVFPDVKVEVQGHTDSSGNPEKNMALSEARAASVKDYLISKGLVASRFTSRGYGQEKPVADNATVEGRQQNRRVELNWLDK